MTNRLLAGLVLAVLAAPSVAGDYPLTVRSCERDVSFDHAPRRAVVHDVNMAGMLLHLGLRERLAGYTGFTANKHREPWIDQALQGVPQLASRYPSVETLLAADADLFFAGWNYGMRVGGPLTPASLGAFGIPVYELSESCSWIMQQPRASLDDVYRDLTNLGRIFSVEDRAQALVGQMRERIAAVDAKVRQQGVPTVFLYDSGEDRPTTSGRLGMPQALIDAAGGRNILDDVEASWTRVNWENVVARNPEVIVIVDYGEISAAQKQQFLEQHPALQSVAAIRDKRFVVIPYVAATPSLDNVEAIEAIAKSLHGA